jgi:uncharacterized protein (DUF1501 family)
VELDRRTFLKKCGGLAFLTAAGVVGLDVFAPLGQTARAAALPNAGILPLGTPILVMIDLAGGNDAANMLINPGDPWYYDIARGHGNIAVQPSLILPMTGASVGLHPSMPWLAQRWNTVRDVAFVQGSGENVKHEFSHFAARYYRNVADFSRTESRGWLGQYNDQLAPASPFASVSLNGVHPSLIGALTPVLTVNNVASCRFSIDSRWRMGFLEAWRAMGAGGSIAGTMLAGEKQNIVESFATQSVVLATNNPTAWNPSDILGSQLAQAAMMIQGGLASQTYVATLRGFDTHGSEALKQGPLLAQLDAALNGFFTAIAASPRAKDVFVLVTSEFGRQQTANASAGCDHGQAGVDILLGAGVTGGLYGEAPLTDPTHRVNDALVPTVDFRSVYATALNRLSKSASMTAIILKGTYTDLGIFAL